MTRRGPRLVIQTSSVYAFDEDRCTARGDDMERLDEIVDLLAEGKRLPKDFRPHPVYTDFPGMAEGHIGDDFLLVYKIKRGLLHLHRCGNHRELFPRSKYAKQ